MKTVVLFCGLSLASYLSVTAAGEGGRDGLASWYGEEHRGKRMANGEKFDPDKLTAASWVYPLGTRVRVILHSNPEKSVWVTITDRGPTRKLAEKGRIIDLAQAAFEELAELDTGLVRVTLQPEEPGRPERQPPEKPLQKLR